MFYNFFFLFFGDWLKDFRLYVILLQISFSLNFNNTGIFLETAVKCL